MTATRYPKPRILRNLPPAKHAVIEASAGTGKTYTLEHLLIDLLLRTDATLEQILVVTFTEKAAAELRVRLRRKITDILQAEGTPEDPDADAWTVDDRARTRLARALLSFDAAAIQTIHGFCHRMLSENAFDNQRLFSEDLVDGKDAFTRAFLDVLRHRLARDAEYQPYLEAWLDEQSLDALVDLLFEAHAKGGAIRPELRLDALARALTVAQKLPLAPNAMRPALKAEGVPPSRVEAILGRLTVLRRLLSDYARTQSLPTLLAAVSREQSARAEGFLPYVIDRLDRHVRTEGVLKEVLDGLVALQAVLVPLGAAVVQLFLPRVQEALTASKARRGELDFDDMLQLLDRSLARPEGAGLLQTLRRRFRYGLIDEFQDTDETQWQIFRRIFLEGGGGRLFVIGDPKQAIYGFRGADVNTYLAARAHVDALGGNVVHLTQNFRSTPELIDAVNQLIAGRFFTGSIRYDHPVTPGTQSQVGLTVDGLAQSAVHLVEVTPNRGTASPSAARRTLADRFAKEIRDLLDPERDVRFGTRGGRTAKLQASHVYVLARTTKEGLEVARHLRRHGVPHAFYKQDGLFQTSEAEDVRAVLAAIAEPRRRSRRLRAWQSPFFSVPLDGLAACADLPGTHPFMERLLVWKEIADAKDYDRLFTRIVEDSGIIERELFLEDSERELTNYLHIFEILTEEASRAKSTLPELVHTLSGFIDKRRLPEGEDGNVQRLESERDAVQIMTMHKAKGLEAPVVFLFGGLDQFRSRIHAFHEEAEGGRRLWIGPNPPPQADAERDEEDQRLLYVALTRAKSRLYLPYFGFAPQTSDQDQPTRAVSRLDGTYAQLVPRLDDVVSRRDEADVARLFTLEQVAELPFFRDAPRADPRADLGTWRPPAALLDPPEPPDAASSLRRAAAGRIVTSYSRIKAAKGGYQAPEARLAPEGDDEVVADVHALPAEDPDLQDRLPGGTGSGRFLHEMLERVPLESLTDAPNLAFWGARQDIRRLFGEGLRKYDRDVRFLPDSLQLVHTALTGPLALEGDVLPGLVAADRVVREMEFLFGVDDPAGAHRGYVKGFIDVVFEHGGKVYLLDWKSDLLPDYGPERLDAHVAANYRVQAEFYTLALVRLLGLEDEAAYAARFGGAVYGFVRGMQSGGDGRAAVYFARPTWAEVEASAAELKTADLGGRAP